MNTKPSHWLSVNRGALALLWTLILALLQTGPALAFVQSTSSAGFPQGSTKVYPLRWDLSGYASGIPFVVKTDNLGDGTSDIPGAEEFPIIRSSFDVWTNVPTSKIKFNQAGVTAQIKVGQSDSVSSIGFREDSVLSQAGVLGMTFQVIGSNPSQPSLLGRITEADILLIDGPKTRWMKSGTNHYPSQPTVATQINLQEIVVREIGEACGLGVSFVRSDYSDPLVLVEDAAIVGDNRDKPFADTAIMYPFPLQDSPVWKNGLLSSDDVAGITTLYPEEAALGSTGSIKGVITMREASTKQVSPVAGAHVMAVDANTLQPQVGTVSDRDGSYEIKGLSAGDYLVWVEPSSPADLIDRLPDLGPENMEFWSEYYNNAYYSQTDKATIVSVAAGQTKGGVDVEVMKTIYDGERTLSAPNETDSEGNRVVLKVEPDNSQEDATLLEDTNGSGVIRVEDILAVDGDTDFYSIIAKRDDIYKVEVYAQRDGAALTPVISLYGPGPQAVPFETESQTPGLDGDAEVTFTAPENNRYFIEISDLNDQGGGLYFYTLVITKLSQRIPIFPTQGPTPVLGIPISDFDLHNAGLTDPEIFGNVEITKLRVQFWDVDGDGGLNSDGSDFLPPTAEVGAGETALESGFALFNDDGNSPGVFDFDPSSLDFAEQDNSIRMAVSPVISPISNGFEVTFTPDSPLVIPAQNVQDSSADVWVVIQPSLNLHHGDDFQVFIPANGIELRVNTEAGPQTVNLFNENTPSIFERDLYTGDVISLTSFIPLAGSLIDANSTDFPVVGINLIGDPNEQYWVSKVEVTFVGFNLINIVEFAPGFNAPWGGLSFFRYPDENIRRAWEMTDLMPLTNGTDKSGGVNLYFDNDSLGSTGDGAPNFGLDGDHLLELDGTQRFEVVDLEEIPTQILEDLILHALLDFTSIDRVLEHRDEVGLFAFKAVLPLKPNPILAFPSTDRSEDSTFGPDMFVSMRTSNLVEALDVFIPFMTVDSVEIKNDLDTVLARGPEFSSLVNGSSYRSIDPRTQPNTTVVEVRPKPSFTLKDLVSPSDLSNRGNTLGTSEEGAAPLAPIGIDANDYRQGALTTMNSDGFSGRDILNTGIILDSIEVILDPVENVEAIDRQYILNVIPDDGDETLGLLNLFSSPDPNLLDFPSRGLEIMVDDDTPEGNFSDDDGDGLADEELVNDSDDDVDGQTDEDDFGDEDAVGLNGQLDPNDDVIAFLQRNDFLPATSFAGYVANPIVQELPNGSLSVNYTNLTSQVTEVRTAGALVNDPLSIFGDAVFFRVDHPVITDEPGVPTA
ncbi:MAG: hypothetical protein KC940_05980, partial [Candidatus Omnitrophica bacterium]|nr:hypothetical protein [Candidatus Omnitrophota bacterium]